MRLLAEQVRLAAPLPAPALIVGEPGSGKESVARVLHYYTQRREKAFVALDCARLPMAAIAEVLSSNRAPANRQSAGTMYLHEPQRLPRDLQKDLVHLLAAADAPRLLAGCATDPDEEVRAGRLLPELWCALSVLVLRVPPLHGTPGRLAVARRADSATCRAPRGRTRNRNHARRLGDVARPCVAGQSVELIRCLVVRRLLAAKGRIDAADLPGSLRLTQRLADTPGHTDTRPLPLDALLEQTERRLIQLALQRARGNKRRAAELLDVSRPRLTRRMEVLGMIDGEPLAELELEEDE